MNDQYSRCTDGLHKKEMCFGTPLFFSDKNDQDHKHSYYNQFLDARGIHLKCIIIQMFMVLIIDLKICYVYACGNSPSTCSFCLLQLQLWSEMC